MKRLLANLLWEPAAMAAAMGWRYRAAREHRRWCDGFRVGYQAALLNVAATANRVDEKRAIAEWETNRLE